MNRRFNIAQRTLPVACFLFIAMGLRCASAQDAPPKEETSQLRFFERPPFDRITLTEEAGAGAFDVRPIGFPNRQVPRDPSPSTRLKVHLIERDVEAEIAWRDIARVELFEQMVMSEAEALVLAKQFDEAYDYFDFLHTSYPKVNGLQQATQRYWYRNAGELFRQGELPQALALLGQLHAQNPNYDGLAAALASVTDRSMTGYVREQNYAAARRLLELTVRRNGIEDRTAAKWRDTLQKAASARLQQAQQQLAAKEYRAARDRALQAVDIWPTAAGAGELLSQINAAYPMLVVAVPQGEVTYAAVPELHPALLRRSELTQRPLVALSGYTASGPVHNSPWGEIKLASDRKYIDLQLPTGRSGATQVTGYDVAELLMMQRRQFDQGQRQQAISIIDAVEVTDVYQVRLSLARGHALPLSWLANGRPAQKADSAFTQGDYEFQVDTDELRFVLHADHTPTVAPREIVEQHSGDPESDIDNLLRGKVDVLLRVDPSYAQRLEEEDVVVQPYALPRVHLLVPNARRPFSANRTFRRAVAYAINRRDILQNKLLGGTAHDGCQTVSGICPTSDNTDDFWSYGYDDAIAPLPFEPALALTLLRVAQDELSQRAANKNGPAPTLDELVIGHEDDGLHAKAAQSIVESLRRLNLPAKSKVIATRDDSQACDFIYAELLLREPVVDVLTVLETPHLPESGVLPLQLRQLARATSWQEASDLLHRIHATMHAEQTVVPLWQITPQFAYRKQVSGIASHPITLYQGVESWRIGQTE